MRASSETLPQDVAKRARGLLLGAAVGDALGWPQEMRSNIVGGRRTREIAPKPEYRAWDRNSGTQFSRYQETVRAGAYSDDTQLLLAVARACERGNSWWRHLTGVELPAWVAYQRGGGRAVVSASRSWAAGQPPWLAATGSARSAQGPAQYFKAGANGVAMRIAPHVLVCLSDADPERLVTRVVADGVTTHGHARALAGGVAHAVTLRAALLRSGTMAYGDLLDQLADKKLWEAIELRDAVPEEWFRSFESQVGERPDVSWRRTVKEVQDLVEIGRRALSQGALADDEATLADMGCFDPKVNGAGTVTAVAAAYVAARSAARPMTGLLRTAYLKRADTDTLASMTASILGALHGPGWLADLAVQVQDADYIARFESLTAGPSPAGTSGQAELFSDGETSVDRASPIVTRQGLKRFADVLVERVVGDTGEFVDGRQFQVREKADLRSKGTATVTRWQLELADGQTLVVDQTRRQGPTSGAGGDHERSDVGRSLKASVSRITLAVEDLSQVAGFYRNIIGLPVHGTGGGFVDLDPGLRLRPRDVTSKAVRDVVLEITVPSLEEVCRRMGLDAPRDQGDALEIRDPEGRTVIVREHSS